MDTISDLNPGEAGTFDFVITNNGGADAYQGQFEIISSSDDITFENPTITVDTLHAGESVTLTVNAQLNPSIQIGSTYEINYHFNSGHYATEGTTVAIVGNIREDFETGDFNQFNWSTGGNLPWTIVTTNVHSGTYCAKSGAITHSQSTELVLTMNVLADGEMSYFRKVSSESNYDKFYFFIDNQQKEMLSGDQDWAEATFNVTAGEHTFTWRYTKDSSVNSGSDCAWIDDIKFPPTRVIEAINSVGRLTASVEDHDVQLTWRGNNIATNYVVRRDGEIIGNTTEIHFTEYVPEDGIYTYSVIAQDADGFSSFPIYVTVSVGTVSVEENHAEVAVYPNPVKDVLNIRVNSDGQYVLYNNIGQQVASGKVSAQEPVKVNNLATGLYILCVTTGTETLTQKIVVE